MIERSPVLVIVEMPVALPATAACQSHPDRSASATPVVQQAAKGSNFLVSSFASTKLSMGLRTQSESFDGRNSGSLDILECPVVRGRSRVGWFWSLRLVGPCCSLIDPPADPGDFSGTEPLASGRHHQLRIESGDVANQQTLRALSRHDCRYS